MIQALIGPIVDLAGGWLKGRADKANAEINLKLVEAEAKATILKSEKTSIADWEKLMAQGAQHSWKDEMFSCILAAPCVLAFCGEWGRQIVTNGFVALEAMPEYYRYFLGCAIAASFGIRGASKYFGKR